MIKLPKKNRNGFFADVSVTNLIDVLFVLLIIFMITASAVVRSNVAINMPEAERGETAPKAEIEIVITRTGEIYIGNNHFELKDLDWYLPRLAEDKNTNKVIVKADGDTPYGLILQVMDKSRVSGLDTLSLAVEEKKK